MIRNVVIPALRSASICCSIVLWLVSTAGAQSSEALLAFANFVKSETFEQADFYLTNGFVKPEQVNTGQIFYDFWRQKIVAENTKTEAAAARIDRVYNYLAKVKPIDLNQRMTCSSSHYDPADTCLLANSVLRGHPISFIAYLVERGLDLNRVVGDIVPASLPLTVRLGTVYSLADLNKLTSLGLVLGDESYSLQTLTEYRDQYLQYDQLKLPGNYLNLNALNFLDMLVIVLGTGISDDAPREAIHDETLCGFILYAAASFTPSFDYLLYLLEARDTFRGANIGRASDHGRSVYMPFPASCVTLVQGMAANHAQIQDVASKFANESDVPTAKWLLTLVPRPQN